MATPSHEIVKTGGLELAIVKGGSGKPPLMLHDVQESNQSRLGSCTRQNY